MHYVLIKVHKTTYLLYDTVHPTLNFIFAISFDYWFTLCSRSIKGLQDWLYYLTYATQVRYASAFLNRLIFLNPSLKHDALPYDSQHNCSSVASDFAKFFSLSNPYCRYANGQTFLTERYTRESTDLIFNGILDMEFNIGITFAFVVGIIIFNLFLYLLPLPAFMKSKFRE